MSIEVLAPVGNKEMFYAALAAGADAIFLATKDFGARAYANNFDLEEIEKIVNISKARSVRVHVTVNTLIKEREMPDAIKLIASLNDIGVDAIIIQDIGLLTIASKMYPDLEFHCSTQLSANNSVAANYLDKLGADRIILARELNYRDIQIIKENSQIDLEVFAHGSICVSYSGKCTMSSYIGARSGNRGRCAQPCRKEYELIGPRGQIINKGYFLSPKDLASKLGARKLEDLGVKSIKIEGRMKKAEYVYNVVKYYKDLIAGENPDEDSLAEVSNRGFTKGILGGHRGHDFIDFSDNANRGTKVGTISASPNRYISFDDYINKGDSLEIELEDKKYTITSPQDFRPGHRLSLDKFPDALASSPVYRISNASLRNVDYKEILSHKKKPLYFSLYAHVGERARLKVKFEFSEIEVLSDEILEKGKNIVLDYDYGYKQLSKLNDTPFYLGGLDLDTDGNSFMPLAMLNQLRRQAIKNIGKNTWPKANPIKTKDEFNEVSQRPEKIIAIEKWDNKLSAYKWDSILLRDLEGLEKIKDNKVFYELPFVIKDREYKKTQEYIESHIDKIDGIAVANPWDIDFVKKFPGLEIIVSEYANSFNTWSVKVLKDSGASRVFLSSELSIADIRQIKKIMDISVVVYSRPIEMIMDHCPGSLIGCDFVCSKCNYRKDHYLRNSSGDVYSFKRNKQGRTELKNIYPIVAGNYIADLNNIGIKSLVYRLDGEEDFRILDDNKGKFTNSARRKGHFEKGVL